MNIQKLKQLYPEMIVQNRPFTPNKGSFYFQNDAYYFAISSNQLTDRERVLLHGLFQQERVPACSEKSHGWYNYLFLDKPLPDYMIQQQLRFTFFRLQSSIEQHILTEWRRALASFFPSSAVFIYLSLNSGIIIEQDRMINAEELLAIANTLESDFSVTCRFQIGLRYRTASHFREAYKEESRMFDEQVFVGSKVISVESRYFQWIQATIKDSAILAEINKAIRQDRLWRPIIQALWEAQGTISLAAKKLSLHRNTLQYRIDKFHEETGISLRRMDGLTLAYLATL
ncbi:helix-turn-helix domain-containing protein [Sporolactobacillus spathodeae]|uniref:PucR C-terminal helix-turn-helix domain-containing protein n=1 Tax=Sporolactobacillus spathodeae TaxID=1465502 RepID=A0ABS2Q4H1_9BACL|nr:helix-turn-helix domain-containing protein [Sporolactobacillus spathodeae]MBM7656672.1 hypothetical protein [Sporolactobacillus spathodeae]